MLSTVGFWIALAIVTAACVLSGWRLAAHQHRGWYAVASRWWRYPAVTLVFAFYASRDWSTYPPYPPKRIARASDRLRRAVAHGHPSLYVGLGIAALSALLILVQQGRAEAAGVAVVVATWRSVEILAAQWKITLWDRPHRRSPSRSVALGFGNLVELVLATALWYSVIALDAPCRFKPTLGGWEAVRLALPFGPSPDVALKGWEPQVVSICGTASITLVSVFILAVLASEIAATRTR